MKLLYVYFSQPYSTGCSHSSKRTGNRVDDILHLSSSRGLQRHEGRNLKLAKGTKELDSQAQTKTYIPHAVPLTSHSIVSLSKRS